MTELKLIRGVQINCENPISTITFKFKSNSFFFDKLRKSTHILSQKIPSQHKNTDWFPSFDKLIMEIVWTEFFATACE